MARAAQDSGRETRRRTNPGPERLNTPGRRRRSALPSIKLDRDAFGKFAEEFARFMGTARFLAYMTAFIIIWLILNTTGLLGSIWDPYPYILLTLMLSLQASYAAPLILLAQNRQEARDRVGLDLDRSQSAQSRADMDFLAREIASLRMSVGEMATRDFLRNELRNELRSILAEMNEQETEDAAAMATAGGTTPGGRERSKNGKRNKDGKRSSARSDQSGRS